MAGVELWWLGQAGFRLRDVETGTTVFCDPFLSANSDRSWSAPVGEADLAQADVVLVSHEHIDHMDAPALSAAAALDGARFTLVLPRPLLGQLALERGGVREIGAQPDEVLDLPGGVRVWPVPARHGIHMADAYSFGTELSGGLVRYLGYVVEIGGARIYHAGDCTPYEGQASRVAALGAHVALLPINGRDHFRETERDLVGNMDSREAARMAADMGVQLLVPMHWELFPANRGYPHELVRYTEEHYPGLTVLIPGRAARFIFTPT